MCVIESTRCLSLPPCGPIIVGDKRAAILRYCDAMRIFVSSALLVASLAACTSGEHRDRSVGQTSFESAPPAGGTSQFGEGDAAGGGGPPSAPSPDAPGGGAAPRTVEETDLYRLEGNRLYYLNSYRGLMVFDVTNADQPRLLGRSPIFGDPVDMIVRDGVAIVVVGDWYGRMDDGTPFRGSIVRGLDATDPANIRVLGEAKLGGWVRDDRVVGDVIYAVSEDYGWSYGWSYGGGYQAGVIVSSVSFANRAIKQVDSVRYDGFAGVFHVTPSSIMLAAPSAEQGNTQLSYLDISDPNGEIVPRGAIDVRGRVQGWGADNGRWNLDFADGKTAHVIAQDDYRVNSAGGYLLSTVDFSNADAPVVASEVKIAQTGWSAAARFFGDRLFLSPESGYGALDATPLHVFDLSNAAAPQLAGSVVLPGHVWNILPASESRIFALGNDDSTISDGGYGSSVALQYLDVSEPAVPRLIGTSTFGDGWAWTPAAGTFKAFTMDAAKGLAVLPFSGWDYKSGAYNNGLQLIEFSPTTIATAGAARSKGWVERGIFVGDRLVSLSDTSLSVVDYANRTAPRLVSELTLARNVVAALPTGNSVIEVSSDWWGNDNRTSQLRLLPSATAEEASDLPDVPSLDIDGFNARVFTHGDFAYIVTVVEHEVACPQPNNGTCRQRAEQVQVVDLSRGGAVLRGKLELPVDDAPYGWYWGYYGCFWYDWWGGDEVLQVEGNALAFRRWVPIYDNQGRYVGTNSKMHIVDLAQPDAPKVASVVVQSDSWWGNMRVVGDTLYATHYEWIDPPYSNRGWVRYYLDSVDLSDRARPRIGRRVNVPGLVVGGDASDPSIVYTIDYRWSGADNVPRNDFDVLRITGSQAKLLSHTTIDGYVGSTFVRGDQAYLSAQRWSNNGPYGTANVDLHAIDLSDPARVRDRVVSENGWGWMLGVEGNRMLVTSGWGSGGLDVYELRDGKAPRFDQTIRTRGWVSGATRKDDTLFLSSGYWGLQKVDLQ